MSGLDGDVCHGSTECRNNNSVGSKNFDINGTSTKLLEGELVYYAGCSTIQEGRYLVLLGSDASCFDNKIAKSYLIDNVFPDELKKYEQGRMTCDGRGWYFTVTRGIGFGFTMEEWYEYGRLLPDSEFGFKLKSDPPDGNKYIRKFVINRGTQLLRWITPQVLDLSDKTFPEMEMFSPC